MSNNKKLETIELQGNDYAKVEARLQEFREKNPRGLIKTEPTFKDNDVVLFSATILKDKKDENSAEATGHALGKVGGKKSFEKLETIAVGRALALLGYAKSGEIASAEEMQEFEKYKEEKRQQDIDTATEKLKGAKNLKALKEVWASLEGSIKQEVQDIKDKQKEKLKKSSNNKSNNKTDK